MHADAFPFPWEEAQERAGAELGVMYGLRYWERVRDHFFALGGARRDSLK
jgi:hypothetical protein